MVMSGSRLCQGDHSSHRWKSWIHAWTSSGAALMWVPRVTVKSLIREVQAPSHSPNRRGNTFSARTSTAASCPHAPVTSP